MLQPNFIGQVDRIGISFKTLEKIAQKLDISYSDFFDFEEIPSKSLLMNSILREFNGLDVKFLK